MKTRLIPVSQAHPLGPEEWNSRVEEEEKGEAEAEREIERETDRRGLIRTQHRLATPVTHLRVRNLTPGGFPPVRCEVSAHGGGGAGAGTRVS